MLRSSSPHAFTCGLLLTAIFFFQIQSPSFSQVQVDPYTGSAQVSIPIWTVQSGELAFPVTLSYRGGGIRTEAPSGNLGIGWSLQAGGSVTRMIKGLPDDLKGTSPTRTGWLTYNSGTQQWEHNGVSDIISDLEGMGTANECENNTVFSKVDDLGGLYFENTILDTEPDIFSVNLPGLSFTFIYDENGIPVVSGSQQVQIQRSPDYSDKIGSFEITDEFGVKYYFSSAMGYSSILAFNSLSGGDTATYFNRYLRMYNSSYANRATFFRRWELNKVVSPTGNEINFLYGDPVPPPPQTLQPQVIFPPDSAPAYPNDDVSINYWDVFRPAYVDTLQVFVYNDQTSQFDTLNQYITRHEDEVIRNVSAIYTNTHQVDFTQRGFSLITEASYYITRTLLGSVSIKDRIKNQTIQSYELEYAMIKSNERRVSLEFRSVRLRKVRLRRVYA